jgi:TonB family protein
MKTTSSISKTALIFGILALFVAGVGAQTASGSEIEWTRIGDDKAGISILFPSGFLIDNEAEKDAIVPPTRFSIPEVVHYLQKPKIMGGAEGVYMNMDVFELLERPNAKNYLWYFVDRDAPKENNQDLQFGNFLGRKTTYVKDNRVTSSIVLAFKSKVFRFYASGKLEDKEVYEKFITSLLMDGRRPFTSSVQMPVETRTLSTSSLKTSPEVLVALSRKPDKSQSPVIRSGPNSTASITTTAAPDFSRPLLILRHPVSDFFGKASLRRYAGRVKLSVNLLSNGFVGDITVLSDAPKGMTDLAIETVRKIKFIPAEVDGKPVDFTRTFEYSFNVD